MKKNSEFFSHIFAWVLFSLALLIPRSVQAQTQPAHPVEITSGVTQALAEQREAHAERDRLRADLFGLIGVSIVLVAGVLILHMAIQNRRWNRVLQFQSDIRSRLLDRFTASQELLTFMGTDAGRRFLEATPLVGGFEPGSQASMPFGRVLLPSQIGVVLTMVGIGLLYLHGGVLAEWHMSMLVSGTITLMLGIGFMISAVMAYWLAKRLDLLPHKHKPGADSGVLSREQL